MKPGIVSRLVRKILPILALLILLFASLYLAGNATTGLSGLGNFYLLIFALTGAAVLTLAVAIVYRIWRLRDQLRTGVTGSRLTRRMVVVFIALSVPPALIVYLFSVDFLSRGIDSWFQVEVEAALDDALVIGQSFLEVQERNAGRTIRRLATRAGNVNDRELLTELTAMADETGALELAVFEQDGRVVTSSSNDLNRLLPDSPPDLAMVQTRRLGFFVDAEPQSDGALEVRAVAQIPGTRIGATPRVIQGIFAVPGGFDERAANVERQFENYRILAYQRADLKMSYVLILSLVLLLSLLLAILLAFNTARKLVMPIGDLADATRRVARGDYEHQLQSPGNDELGFLVESFNAMTDEIATTSAAAETSRIEAEQGRDYYETILARLSSGVMTLDEDLVVVTVNAAAGRILGLERELIIGRSLDDLVVDRPDLGPLAYVIGSHGKNQDREWRHEVSIEQRDEPLMVVCRGARLTRYDHLGQVVVLDDVTQLVRAQRSAAWGEVARRLAHEVKNPLTPIQLAAERIRHRFLGKLPAEDGDILDRSTRTIVNQVEALKTMVNAFSEYARAPTLHLEPSHLSVMVEEVLDLYRQDERIQCSSRYLNPEPRVLVDKNRVRQQLHNLIKNAREAAEPERLEMMVETHLIWRAGKARLSLTLRDNGPGIPQSVIDKLFEPYATTKARGTGIGLAIVKKIAEEHGGDIRARNADTGGAIFDIEFPVESNEIANLDLVPAGLVDRST